MALESRESNHLRGSSTSLVARGLARAALAVVALLGLTAALGAQGVDRAKVGEAVKDVKYDADREVVEFSVDPIALPPTRSFAASDAGRLNVACYTRPFLWCSPEAGMSYDGTDLWRIPRATAPSVDVRQTPLTLLARYVVGRRDDARSPAVSPISMELHAKGAAISRWDSATR